MNQSPLHNPQDTKFREVGAVIKRRWLLIVITIGVCFGLGVLYTTIAEPIYRSAVQVELEGRTVQFASTNPLDPLNPVTVPNPTDDIPTQVEVLKSETVQNDAFHLLQIPPPPKSPELAVDPLVQVRQVGPTNLLEIEVDSKNPDLAAKMAEALPIAYENYVRTKLQGQLSGGIKYVQSQVDEADKKLKDLQNQQEAFRQKYHISNLEQENMERIQQVGQAESEMRVADSRVATARDYLNSLRQARAQLPPLIDQQGDAPFSLDIEKQKEKIADLRSQLEVKRATYSDNSREVKGLLREIGVQEVHLRDMPKKIANGAKVRNPLISQYDEKVADASGQYQGALAARSDASAQLSLAQRKLDELTAHAGESSRITSALDTANMNYQAKNRQLQDLTIRQSSAKTPINEVSRATTPEIVKPRPALNLTLAAIVGLIAAAGLASLRERADDRIYSAEIARQVANVRAIGAVPLGASNKPALIADGAPYAESYRLLRSNVLFTVGGEPMRSISVVSAFNNEGRSEVAANLAASLALGSHQVVLVDANFRRPSVHKMMNVAEGPGLSDVLLGMRSATDVAQRSTVEGLSIITAGDKTQGPTELLSSEAFPALLEELKEQYHFIIVETAPCMADADAQITAAACDASLFVLKIGTSRRSATRYCIDLLQRTRTNLLGVVYNRPGKNPRTHQIEVESYEAAYEV